MGSLAWSLLHSGQSPCISALKDDLVSGRKDMLSTALKMRSLRDRYAEMLSKTSYAEDKEALQAETLSKAERERESRRESERDRVELEAADARLADMQEVVRAIDRLTERMRK
ncbi:hypothetical protein KIPB_002199 [Kipferlia bialata]|uniref:Uncharacterized protein n=1 Tax=Kipferlia bialata TaxID=797122 RepID=A0A9K3GGH0_9EUKA|nr:hypothetical protein KIPB_002199 [Kipferlia bialata]|eukprot:g2199.t1